MIAEFFKELGDLPILTYVAIIVVMSFMLEVLFVLHNIKNCLRAILYILARDFDVPEENQ